MRRVLPLLLLALLGHRDNARAIMALRTRATRPPTAVPSDLAFATPPTPPQSPGLRRIGGAWTSRSSSSSSSSSNDDNNRVSTPPGGHPRGGVCPLGLTRRRRGGGGNTAEPPPTASPLTHSRRKRKGATAPAAAAATKGVAVRLEPLNDISSGGGGDGKKGGIPAQAGPSVKGVPAGAPARQKKARSPRHKGVSRAAAAAAAVDPFPASSAFVAAPATIEDASGTGGGTSTSGAAMTPGRGAKSTPGSAATGAAGTELAAAAAAPPAAKRRARKYGSSSLRRTADGQPAKQRWGALSAKRAKALRTGGKAFFIVCDAESITCPELLETIEILDELGTRDVGVIYADWKNNPNWRSDTFNRSKACNFELVQRESLPAESFNPPGDDTLTAEVVALARSEAFKKYEFCLVSADGSLTDLSARLREEGRLVRGIGRRQAPEQFLKNCDAFMYVDPANRYELLDDEGLVISVALCIALAAAGQERCDWVRMKTIVNSLHSWDLGLESPNYFGYFDYDEMVVAMDTYVTGIEDTSGEVVVKVPPKPKAGEVPRGLEDVATYLYRKWVSFTEEPRMNDILLACIPACLQALSVARAEMSLAVKRFQQDGTDSLGSLDHLLD